MTEQPKIKEVDAEVVDVEFVEETPGQIKTHKAAKAVAVLESASQVAHTLGADGVSELSESLAEIARRAPGVVEKLRTEGAPLMDAVTRLWNTAEKHGIVGRKPPNAWAAKK